MNQFALRRGFSNLSYSHGLGRKQLQYVTIGRGLKNTVDKYPDSPGLISAHQNISLTYQQLWEKAITVAGAFKALKLKKHQRIGIYSPNNIEWTIAQFAASLSDLILVNINPAYRVDELKYALNKVECTALITAAKFKKSDYVKMLHELIPELPKCRPGDIKSHNVPSLHTIIKIDDGINTPGMMNYSELYQLGTKQHITEVLDNERYIDPDDPTNIQFTSGTTGFPKGATLSHMNIFNNGANAGERLNYTNKDLVCIPVPLYHTFGMVLGNMACISSGAAMVYPSDSFCPKSTLEGVTKYKCTSLYGVPTMFLDVANELQKAPKGTYDVSTLRTGIMAGSICPRVLMERCVNELNLKGLSIGYGMTELSPLVTHTLPTDPTEKRVGTVGPAAQFVEMKLVDDHGRTVPRGEVGEMCARGYNVMKGYWGDEKATRKTITPEGWLHTGDTGVMDNDGYVVIVGRKKDMISRGGEKVFPKEVEDFLLKHPNIDDAQVIGVPDERYGEEIAVWIKLKVHARGQVKKEDILAFCKEQISHYKIPKYVKFVDGFPMTITGKIQKFVMRDDMAKDLADASLRKSFQIRDW